MRTSYTKDVLICVISMIREISDKNFASSLQLSIYDLVQEPNSSITLVHGGSFLEVVVIAAPGVVVVVLTGIAIVSSSSISRCGGYVDSGCSAYDLLGLPQSLGGRIAKHYSWPLHALTKKYARQ